MRSRHYEKEEPGYHYLKGKYHSKLFAAFMCLMGVAVVLLFGTIITLVLLGKTRESSEEIHEILIIFPLMLVPSILGFMFFLRRLLFRNKSSICISCPEIYPGENIDLIWKYFGRMPKNNMVIMLNGCVVYEKYSGKHKKILRLPFYRQILLHERFSTELEGRLSFSLPPGTMHSLEIKKNHGVEWTIELIKWNGWLTYREEKFILPVRARRSENNA